MLVWSWDEKCGELKYGNYTSNLYEGNALMIMISEWTNDEGIDQYQVWGFFADKEHAKNCLGLSKGHENIYADCPWEKLTIYRSKSRNWKQFVELVTKAFPEIEVHLLP